MKHKGTKTTKDSHENQPPKTDGQVSDETRRLGVHRRDETGRQ